MTIYKNNMADNLEIRSEIEAEKLGVAEEFGYVVAILACALAWIKTEWYWGIMVGIAAYWLSTNQFRGRADRAEDAYHQAAKIGKYSTARAPSAPSDALD